MGRKEWLALGLLAAAFMGGAALAGAGDNQVPWFISRAAGLGAFVVLSLSVVLGLLVSSRAAEPAVPRAFSFELHGFLSMLSLTLVAIHGGALLFDSWFHFTPLAILVPFVAPYSPLWTGLGVIAAWTMAIVAGSFWARRSLGYTTWRRLHYASFAVYVLALVHGLAAGTDTVQRPVAMMYTISAAVVAGLLTYRIGSRGEGRARASARPRPRTQGIATPYPARTPLRDE